jgi:hypothetical protein
VYTAHKSRPFALTADMEPFATTYELSLKQFAITKNVADATALADYATAQGYTQPPSTGLTTTHASKISKACANCGSEPKHRCVGCIEGVDRHGEHSPTFYCGKDCQQKHWQTMHKTECKAANHRKQLYRAGAILQHMFEVAQRLSWCENIQEARWAEQDGQEKLIVRLGEFITARDLLGFPDEILPDQRAKQALLAHGAGMFAVATLSRTLGQLLKGKSPSAVHKEFLANSTRYMRNDSHQ